MALVGEGEILCLTFGSLSSSRLRSYVMLKCVT
jgi:hypothetical protein